MNLFRYDNNTKHTGDVIEHHNHIHHGEFYELHGCVNHTTFDKKSTTLVDEIASDKGMMVVMDEKGLPPFAAFTNDSRRDTFQSEDILARIVTKHGYHVAMAFFPEDEKKPLPLYIFKIEDLNSNASSIYDSVIVQCIYKGDTLIPVNKFERVTEHLVKLSKQVDLIPQLKNKYCFQTTRKVLLCFMSKDEKDQVFTTREKRMILNYNSQARFDKGEVVDEGIFRVFYSRRFKNSDEVYVEGVRIDDSHLDFDIQEFIKSTDNNIVSNIRVLTTRNGRKMYAVVNNKGEIRPIIKLGNFTSFALSPDEIEHNIVDVQVL